MKQLHQGCMINFHKSLLNTQNPHGIARFEVFVVVKIHNPEELDLNPHAVDDA